MSGTNSDEKAPRKPGAKASRAELAIKVVNLEKLERKLKTVLLRQVDRLMVSSHLGLLDKDQLAALALCSKLLKDYHKEEKALLAEMSEDELAAIATKG